MLNPLTVCVGLLVENILKQLGETALESDIKNMFGDVIKNLAISADSAGYQNDVGAAINGFTHQLFPEGERVICDNIVPEKIAVCELANRWKNDPITLASLKLIADYSDSSAVRIQAIKEVSRGWRNDSQTLYWLKRCAQSSNKRNVRIAAVEELASGWKDDPGLLELLGDRAWGDRDPEFRDFAQRKLTELKGDRK